jgi:hypothetical protein
MAKVSKIGSKLADAQNHAAQYKEIENILLWLIEFYNYILLNFYVVRIVNIIGDTNTNTAAG